MASRDICYVGVFPEIGAADVGEAFFDHGGLWVCWYGGSWGELVSYREKEEEGRGGNEMGRGGDGMGWVNTEIRLHSVEIFVSEV